jgi:hypothetical protein
MLALPTSRRVGVTLESDDFQPEHVIRLRSHSSVVEHLRPGVGVPLLSCALLRTITTCIAAAAQEATSSSSSRYMCFWLCPAPALSWLWQEERGLCCCCSTEVFSYCVIDPAGVVRHMAIGCCVHFGICLLHSVHHGQAVDCNSYQTH